MKLAAARGREQAVRGNLAVLQLENVTDERLTRAQGQLAESLAAQGKFLEAAAVAPTNELVARYSAIHDAVHRPDTDACDCPETVTDPRGANGTSIELPNSFVEEMVYSEERGHERPLVRCLSCGDLNAKPAPAALAAVMDAHKQSRSK
jgi:hypothetical protein